MDTVAKSDFFFFVTTIAVIVVTLVLIVALTYVIRIASDIKYISKRAKEETDDIADDIRSARENLKSKGKLFATLFTSLWALGKKKKTKQDKNK